MEYEVSIFTTTRKIFVIEADKPDEARNIALMQINDNENMTHSSEDTNITVNPLNKTDVDYNVYEKEI